MGRAARGVIGMRLEGGSKVISMLVAGDESQYVLTACENGYGKCTPITEYTRHGRATQGMIAIATSERNGKVVAAVLVRPEDSVMLLTENGKLVRTPVADIRVCGRSTQGVTLIDIKTISSCACLALPRTMPNPKRVRKRLRKARTRARRSNAYASRL